MRGPRLRACSSPSTEKLKAQQELARARARLQATKV
ncbi:MAG: ATP synthase delta/epsilon chain alpha-helix domain-containing protein [Vulcanococcus sp.]